MVLHRSVPNHESSEDPLHEVPVDDWIEIGVFAKLHDPLYRKRVHITERDSTFWFKTAQLSDQVKGANNAKSQKI